MTGHLNVGADRDRGRRDRLSRLIASDAARSARRIEPLVIELLIREDIRGRHGGVGPARVICWRSIVWRCHDLMPLSLHRLPTKDAAGIISGGEPIENGLVEFLNAFGMFVACVGHVITKAVLVVEKAIGGDDWNRIVFLLLVHRQHASFRHLTCGPRLLE